MHLLKHFMYVKWTKKYGRTFTWISRYQSVLRTASLLKDHSIFKIKHLFDFILKHSFRIKSISKTKSTFLRPVPNDLMTGTVPEPEVGNPGAIRHKLDCGSDLTWGETFNNWT